MVGTQSSGVDAAVTRYVLGSFEDLKVGDILRTDGDAILTDKDANEVESAAVKVIAVATKEEYLAGMPAEFRLSFPLLCVAHLPDRPRFFLVEVLD